MSESLFPTFRRFGYAILHMGTRRRADPKAQFADTNLPPILRELICQVVKRTRLFKSEKASVAEELIAHFQDGLAAGATADEMLGRFGDRLVAAKLIRRAKRQCRPAVWYIWNFAWRSSAVLVAVYAVLVIRFCVEHPTPSVDYLAKLNEPILSIPQDARAWPLWEKALTSLSKFSGNVPTAGWLKQNRVAIQFGHEASRKSAFGFILGPRGSIVDPRLYPWYSPVQSNPSTVPVASLLLPYVNEMRWMGMIFSGDAKLAAADGNGAAVESDLISMLELARQLRHADGIMVTQLMGLDVKRMATGRLQSVLTNHSSLLTNAQLIRLGHAIADGNVAGDLLDLKYDRYGFPDIVQRIYTDDGHMSLQGARAANLFLHGADAQQQTALNQQSFILVSTLPMALASRSELTAEFDSLMDQTQANFDQPARRANYDRFNSQIRKLQKSPLDKFRYALLIGVTPDYRAAQSRCEEYFGERDGALVGIALELYHRQFRKYPASLSELTSEYLPQIPADRITGEPVKYRLIRGMPIVYSVGVDRIDDGGKVAAARDGSSAAQWGVKPADVIHGDWILYPPDTAAN